MLGAGMEAAASLPVPDPQVAGRCPGWLGAFFCSRGQSRVCPDSAPPTSAPWTPLPRAPAPFPPPLRPSLVEGQRWRGGVGAGRAERQGGLLAGVQRVELSPLAPSFASGQEAELRWKGRRRQQAASQPPRPGALSPPLSASGLRLCSPISLAAAPDPHAPWISDPPAPVCAASLLAPSPPPPHGWPFPQASQGRGTPLAPHRQPWAVSAASSLVGWLEGGPAERQQEPPPHQGPR